MLGGKGGQALGDEVDGNVGIARAQVEGQVQVIRRAPQQDVAHVTA